jgi:hypothetical protein
LLNDQWVIEKTRKEIKKFLEFNENENSLSVLMGHSKHCPKRKVCSHECLVSANIKNTEQYQIHDLILYLKLLEKQEVNPKQAEGYK